MDAGGKSEAERLSAVVLDSLDEEGATSSLARRAHWSRTHFHRLFRALIDEAPGGMRRRLLLERAAWQLGRTRLPVTEIALESLYGSLEAFTRAFRRAFGISPSLYRRLGATHFRLPASNGIHFGASGSPAKGASDMDLFDRFAGHDSWHTRRLLEQAGALTDDQLDQPLTGTVKVLPWEERDRTLPRFPAWAAHARRSSRRCAKSTAGCRANPPSACSAIGRPARRASNCRTSDAKTGLGGKPVKTGVARRLSPTGIHQNVAASLTLMERLSDILGSIANRDDIRCHCCKVTARKAPPTSAA